VGREEEGRVGGCRLEALVVVVCGYVSGWVQGELQARRKKQAWADDAHDGKECFCFYLFFPSPFPFFPWLPFLPLEGWGEENSVLVSRSALERTEGEPRIL